MQSTRSIHGPIAFIQYMQTMYMVVDSLAYSIKYTSMMDMG